MGAIRLDGTTPGYPSLEAVVRGAGLAVRLWDGWQDNGRSSGGFESLLGVVVHHTASPPTQSFDNDWRYCAVGHQDAPVANMLLGRDGLVGIHAGLASNHAGKGGPWAASKGTVPLDSANSRMLGIEAQNNGTGELWAGVMLEAYEVLVAALCEAYGFVPATDSPAHFQWAPTRKIDPWGGSAGTAGFDYTGPDEWRMPGFTSNVAARMGGAQPPEDDDMPRPYLVQTREDGAVYSCDGAYVQYRHVRNAGSLDRIRADMRAKGYDDALNLISLEQLTDQGVRIGPAPGEPDD